MFGIGAQELLVIAVIALLIFGPKRLPELARSLGKGLAEFRRASSDLRQSLSAEDAAEPPRGGAVGAGNRPDAAEADRPAQSVSAPEPAAEPAKTPGADAARTAGGGGG